MNKKFDRKGSPSADKFGDRRSGAGFKKPAMLHRTTCSKCGTQCEVPFKPTGERPVLCNNCFKRDGVAPRTPSYGYGDERRSYAPEPSAPAYKSADPSIQKQLTIINAKLDQLLDILSELEED